MGPGEVEQRPCHWESGPPFPRHHLCVSCLHKRHTRNPVADHCQEARDTESRAVGKGDWEAGGGPRILRISLRRVQRKEEQKLPMRRNPLSAPKGRDSGLPCKVHTIPLSNRRREQRCWTAQGFSWSFLKFSLLLELKPGFCQPLSRGGGRNFFPYLQVGFKYYILNQNSVIWQIYFLLRPTLKYIKSLCFPPL